MTLLTKTELTHHWSDTLDELVATSFNNPQPGNQYDEGHPDANRDWYNLLSIALSYVCQPDIRIKMMFKNYREALTPHGIPWSDQASPLLAELSFCIGYALVIDRADPAILSIVRRYANTWNPANAEDKQALMYTAAALMLGETHTASLEVIVNKRIKRPDGCWIWPQGGSLPADPGHSNRWYMMDSICWLKPQDLHGMTAALSNNTMYEMDFLRGTTADRMGGIDTNRRCEAGYFGRNAWMAQHEKKLMRIWATGWLTGFYADLGSTTVESTPMARLSLAAAGLAATP